MRAGEPRWEPSGQTTSCAIRTSPGPGGDHASSRTDPDDAERLTDIYGYLRSHPDLGRSLNVIGRLAQRTALSMPSMDAYWSMSIRDSGRAYIPLWLASGAAGALAPVWGAGVRWPRRWRWFPARVVFLVHAGFFAECLALVEDLQGLFRQCGIVTGG